ncbi:MAG TPA: response regulator [Vicinamibacterales bacterium]|nr:response regulator [Vicinamibacterales bacterium]
MKPLNCLIVDDSSVMRRMVRRTMELSEVPLGQVHEANNGREALDLLATTSVDVLFTDINMPVMNGPDLLRALAKQPDAVRARVVISTDGSEARRAEVVGLNVDWYLEKPLRPEVMRDVLSKVAERVHG